MPGRALTLLVVLVGAACAAAPAEARAQEIGPGDVWSELLSSISPLLIPKLFADQWLVKEYVRGEEFQLLREERGDLAAVDAVFEYALSVSWGNVFEALLVSTVATMDHRRVGVDLPLLGPMVWFPLTSEFEEDFSRRVACLPAAIYHDTPPARGGDRDKLQHFFGSALLAYVSESRRSADDVGSFVEWGEERFIVGGVSDPRDLRADREGREFGLSLLADRTLRPSTFLHPVIAVRLPGMPAAPDSLCGGMLYEREVP